LEKYGKCAYETLLALAGAFDLKVQELTFLLNKTNGSKRSISILGLNFNLEWLTPGKALWTGLISAFPAFYFIFANVLHYGLGIKILTQPLMIFYETKEILAVFNIISSIVFLLGLGTAAVLNLFSLLSFNLQKDGEAINSSLLLKPRIANLLLFSISIFSILLMFAYVMAENFTLRVH
jgi:hypothetical protein